MERTLALAKLTASQLLVLVKDLMIRFQFFNPNIYLGGNIPNRKSTSLINYGILKHCDTINMLWKELLQTLYPFVMFQYNILAKEGTVRQPCSDAWIIQKCLFFSKYQLSLQTVLILTPYGLFNISWQSKTKYNNSKRLQSLLLS